MEIKIKLYKLEDLDKNLKATIHRTGKMGFTADAAKKLKLPSIRSADIGFNSDDANDKNLYLFLHPEPKRGQFNVVKAGAYYYINTKVLYDNLKLDYVKETISYDITPQQIGGEQAYILKRRVKTPKTRSFDFDEEDS